MSATDICNPSWQRALDLQPERHLISEKSGARTALCSPRERVRLLFDEEGSLLRKVEMCHPGSWVSIVQEVDGGDNEDARQDALMGEPNAQER